MGGPVQMSFPNIPIVAMMPQAPQYNGPPLPIPPPQQHYHNHQQQQGVPVAFPMPNPGAGQIPLPPLMNGGGQALPPILGGGGGGGGNTGFTNASLKGQYAFTLRGVGTPDQVNSFFFVEGGVFTADGNGNLSLRRNFGACDRHD